MGPTPRTPTCHPNQKHYGKGLCQPCYRRQWRSYNPDAIASYRPTPEQERELRLKYKFGLTLDQYNEMLAAQGGVCAMCGGLDPIRNLAVDHDHKTGAIRGLLCGTCNTALGVVEKYQALATEYLATRG